MKDDDINPRLSLIVLILTLKSLISVDCALHSGFFFPEGNYQYNVAIVGTFDRGRDRDSSDSESGTYIHSVVSITVCCESCIVVISPQ